MPQTFKALATIAAWILWIVGMVMGFSALIMGIISGDLYVVGHQTPMGYYIAWAIAGFYVILAVIIMILRKKME